MIQDTRRSGGAIRSQLDRIRRHPAISTLFVISIIAGALLGALELPDEIGLARRVIGGAICGGGIAFLMTATKMLR